MLIFNNTVPINSYKEAKAISQIKGIIGFFVNALFCISKIIKGINPIKRAM